jgi:hypothetical protein
LDVGLNSEFTRGSRVAIGDEVVHDQVINVTRAWALAAVADNQVMLITSRMQKDVTKGSDRQVNVFLLKVFQRDSQLEFKIHHVTARRKGQEVGT